jgi:hypothetical protein
VAAAPAPAYGRGAGLAEQARRIHRIDIDDAIQTERAQIRDPQRNMTRDVAERVAPFIAVRRRIRQLAAADAVEDDQENAGKGCQACWGEK